MDFRIIILRVDGSHNLIESNSYSGAIQCAKDHALSDDVRSVSVRNKMEHRLFKLRGAGSQHKR